MNILLLVVILIMAVWITIISRDLDEVAYELKNTEYKLKAADYGLEDLEDKLYIVLGALPSKSTKNILSYMNRKLKDFDLQIVREKNGDGVIVTYLDSIDDVLEEIED